MSDRPIFGFGDGMTLVAKNRVDLEGTSLGDISFYVLDGDYRASTWKAEETPLVGGRFFYEHQVSISHEHLTLFLRNIWGDLLMAYLDHTMTGHLVLDPSAPTTDLPRERTQLEERFQFQLSCEGSCLVEIVTMPGALDEIQRMQHVSMTSEKEACPVKGQVGDHDHGCVSYCAHEGGRQRAWLSAKPDEHDTEVQTAAPTLSRAGRQVLLAAAANAGCKVESAVVRVGGGFLT